MSTDTRIPDDEPVIIMTRDYDAPRELVWEASTEPVHIRRWWGGAGVTSPVCEMDLRPGGRWRHVMRFPDGREIALDFEFVEVEPPARLVWRDSGRDKPSGMPRPHFTSTLEEVGNRTRCTLVIRFASIEERDAAVEFGFTGPIEQSNDLFAEYVESLRERV